MGGEQLAFLGVTLTVCARQYHPLTRRAYVFAVEVNDGFVDAAAPLKGRRCALPSGRIGVMRVLADFPLAHTHLLHQAAAPLVHSEYPRRANLAPPRKVCGVLRGAWVCLLPNCLYVYWFFRVFSFWVA